jgi:hypothetical protein
MDQRLRRTKGRVAYALGERDLFTQTYRHQNENTPFRGGMPAAR